MTADLARALSAIRTIRANRAEQRETERIGDRARATYGQGVRMAKLDAVVSPASELAVSGSFLAVLLVGGVRVATGTIEVSDLVAFLLYMTYLVVPVGSLFQAVSAIQQGTGALQRINEILDLPREPASMAPAIPPPRLVDTPTSLAAPAPILQFSDVWFNLAPLVSRLPFGLDTPVGEHGLMLSGENASGWLSPGPCCTDPASCCWMNPPPTWTP